MKILVILVGTLCGLAEAARGASIDDIQSIAVYSTTGRSRTTSADISAFLSGYLSNIKNYTAHNLDLYYVQSFVDARRKAAELGAGGLLAVHAESFTEYKNTAAAQLRLFDTKSGSAIREWSARLVVPYFDPPQYRHIQPYGNLDQVFSELPLRSYEAPVEIRLLVVSDQRLRGSSRSTREYLLSQVETASRVLEREFGIALSVTHLKRWSPPDVDIFGIARAASGISGREGADLTLVCLGPPAPVTYWDGGGILGYARVLTNVVVTRVMNAHVFVHEIGHVLGAIHIEQEGGVIMEPTMRNYAIDSRFRVLPPMLFSGVNRRIMEITRTIPLGAGFEQHADKMAQLLVAYEGLRETRLKEIAPYYGGLLVDLGRTDEAIAVFQSALGLAPNLRVVRTMLIDALRRAGRYPEAQQMVQEEFDLGQARVKGVTGGAVRLSEYSAISLSASFLSFGEVGVGEQRSLKFTIANLGTATLEISRIQAPGRPFSLAASTPRDARIEPGESLALETLFQPLRGGRFQSTLEIVSNARGGKTAEVRLSGQGVE
ncbi:MAG: M12 family metallo-peptidase [Candidatus Latescibacterota bacterium]|nr:M12 family metallo-peptidase [Candidatus Latescibacterota bacterium]